MADTTINVSVSPQYDALSKARSARDDAIDARDLAELWASAGEDVEVQNGKFSAFHHATKASESATAAQQAESEAKSARDVAQAAESGAQTAESNAQAAETDAESARDTAQTEASNAASSASTAQTAASDAQSARDTAQTARDDAQAAETDAESARDAAQQAEQGAISARDAAQQAESEAKSARDTAQAAESGAQTAESNAQAAETGAENARDQAQALIDDLSGTGITDEWLREVIQSFSPTSTTRDAGGRISEQSGTFRDGSTGTMTITRTQDGAVGMVEYTHVGSGKTLTQSISRDAEGRYESTQISIS